MPCWLCYASTAMPAVPCHAMPCHSMPCHSMPCHAMPCHAMPCHAMPCHAMPCHAMPCHAGHATPCRLYYASCDCCSVGWQRVSGERGRLPAALRRHVRQLLLSLRQRIRDRRHQLRLSRWEQNGTDDALGYDRTRHVEMRQGRTKMDQDGTCTTRHDTTGHAGTRHDMYKCSCECGTCNKNNEVYRYRADSVIKLSYG